MSLSLTTSDWMMVTRLIYRINCIDAIENGVSRVHILDGRIPHCLLLEIFTNKGIGTAILKDEESRFYHEK